MTSPALPAAATDVSTSDAGFAALLQQLSQSTDMTEGTQPDGPGMPLTSAMTLVQNSIGAAPYNYKADLRAPVTASTFTGTVGQDGMQSDTDAQAPVVTKQPTDALYLVAAAAGQVPTIAPSIPGATNAVPDLAQSQSAVGTTPETAKEDGSVELQGGNADQVTAKRPTAQLDTKPQASSVVVPSQQTDVREELSSVATNTATQVSGRNTTRPEQASSVPETFIPVTRTAQSVAEDMPPTVKANQAANVQVDQKQASSAPLSEPSAPQAPTTQATAVANMAVPTQSASTQPKKISDEKLEPTVVKVNIQGPALGQPAKAAPRVATYRTAVRSAPEAAKADAPQDKAQDSEKTTPAITPENSAMVIPPQMAPVAAPAVMMTASTVMATATRTPAPAASEGTVQANNIGSPSTKATTAAAAESKAKTSAGPQPRNNGTATNSDEPEQSTLSATSSNPGDKFSSDQDQKVTAPAPHSQGNSSAVAVEKAAAPAQSQPPSSDAVLVQAQQSALPNTPIETNKLTADVQVSAQHHDAEAVSSFDKIGLTIAAHSSEGKHQFDIRLDPAELGRVHVHLAVDEEGQAQATLVADNPKTLELLQRDSSNLNRTLQDAGLNLSQSSLNFSLREQYRQNDNSGGQGRSRNLSAQAVLSADAPQSRSSQGSYAPNSVRLDIRV
ncbi:hypothetical protein GCM10008941_31660 [Rhizomicrobium palustre]